MSYFNWNERLPEFLKPGFQPPTSEIEEDMKRRHHSELIEYERFATKIRSEYTKSIDKSRAVQQLSGLKQKMRERHMSEEAILSGSGCSTKRLQILLNTTSKEPAAQKDTIQMNTQTEGVDIPPPHEARGLIGGALSHANRVAELNTHKVLRSTSHRTALDNEIIERYVKKMEARSGPGARFGFIQKVNQKAASLGKRVVTIESDNHCLYNSIIAGLHGAFENSNEAVKQLRNLVGDYILAHSDTYTDIINVMVQMSLTAYVDGIKTEAIGDELECSVAAKVLGVTIHLVTPDDDVRVFPADGSSSADVWIAYYPSYTILGDAHYNALK